MIPEAGAPWRTTRIYDMMWMAALALRRDGASIPPELTSYDDDDWTDIAYTPSS